jgi:hypothetical protein
VVEYLPPGSTVRGILPFTGVKAKERVPANSMVQMLAILIMGKFHGPADFQPEICTVV